MSGNKTGKNLLSRFGFTLAIVAIGFFSSVAVCVADGLGNGNGSGSGGEQLFASASKTQPNILLITVDNLGYGDLRSFRAESETKTPRLDQFARQGAKLTSFYTASPTCTVSRACLLTGRLPHRHGLRQQLPGLEGNYGVGLDRGETLIPQVLKNANPPYASGCFGKWNIGFAPGSRPTERGFDEFIGHASGNMDYYHHVYNGKHDLYQGTASAGITELHRPNEYCTDIFAAAAIDFIRRQTAAETPWFCYLPFNAPHFPNKRNKQPGQPTRYQAPDWAFAAYGWSPDETDPKRRYDAVVYALDVAIGRVLDSLEDAGVAQNTFVFFMSDNGAFRLDRAGLDVGINEPLRHGGVTCWEGGIRVAALARWPGHIRAGSVCSEPLWSPDLLVACAELAAAPLPATRLDGKNPLPTLAEGAASPHESLFFTYQGHAALRAGEWKIVREQPTQPWMLFHLGNDIGEQHNQATNHPRQIERLTRLFAQWESGE